MYRFFAPLLDSRHLDQGDVALPPEEAEHLTRVLRLGVGDEVAVFDGRGGEVLARVVAAGRRDVHLRVLSPIEAVSEPRVPVTLVQAVLKGEKMDEVVRDAVMLGAAAIQPVVTQRSETAVAVLRGGARPDRWRRVALASVKQSGRAVLPEVRPPLTFDAYLATARAPLTLMLVEPAAGGTVESLAVLGDEPAPAAADVLVGPEGGWSAAECEAARARGIRLFRLGPRTLRADAVALSVLSVLQFLWERA